MRLNTLIIILLLAGTLSPACAVIDLDKYTITMDSTQLARFEDEQTGKTFLLIVRILIIVCLAFLAWAVYYLISRQHKYNVVEEEDSETTDSSPDNPPQGFPAQEPPVIPTRMDNRDSSDSGEATSPKGE